MERGGGVGAATCVANGCEEKVEREELQAIGLDVGAQAVHLQRQGLTARCGGMCEQGDGRASAPVLS